MKGNPAAATQPVAATQNTCHAWLQEARAESTSSADKERHPSGEHAEELQHAFDADDADLAPAAAQAEQPSPAGDRIQSSEHPFEPGGQLQVHAPAGGIRSSFSSASGGPARMSFDESSSQPGGRGPPSADTSPPVTPLQQHHGQSLEGLPALRDPSGSVPLSADAAAAMAAASGTLRGRSTPPPPSSPLPGGSPRGMSPLRLHSPAQSVDESMGVSAVGGGSRGGGRATPGSDGGSAMSLDALDSPAPQGGARPTLEQAQGPLSAASFGSGEHRLADRSMVHSGSDKTLKGIDSEQLSTQLGLIGMKRSGSGVLSPQPRAPERKVPFWPILCCLANVSPPVCIVSSTPLLCYLPSTCPTDVHGCLPASACCAAPCAGALTAAGTPCRCRWGSCSRMRATSRACPLAATASVMQHPCPRCAHSTMICCEAGRPAPCGVHSSLAALSPLY